MLVVMGVVFSRFIALCIVAIHGFNSCEVGTENNMTILVISGDVFTGFHRRGVPNVMDTVHERTSRCVGET